jgi:energy-coupling factor transporter ATP-binding protein EcfA2
MRKWGNEGRRGDGGSGGASGSDRMKIRIKIRIRITIRILVGIGGRAFGGASMSMIETVRVREVGMRFGIGWGEEGWSVRGRAEAVARTLEVPREGIVLITGASGSGKTTVLRAVEERMRGEGVGRGTRGGGDKERGRGGDGGMGGDMLLTRESGAARRADSKGRGAANGPAPRQKHGTRPYVRLERIRLPGRAVVDCFGMPLEETLGLLCRAGLAEARVWLRRPGELSEGERFRFRLARWMAGRAQVLLADEFCNGLDRVTARGVAWQLRRFVAESGRAAVVATAHEDLAADLLPARWVRM